jgi:hypothetical protein
VNVQTMENRSRNMAENRASELPVNLPDTAEMRGVAHPFPENSGQNASERTRKGKTENARGGLAFCKWGYRLDTPGFGAEIARPSLDGAFHG